MLKNVNFNLDWITKFNNVDFVYATVQEKIYDLLNKGPKYVRFMEAIKYFIINSGISYLRTIDKD